MVDVMSKTCERAECNVRPSYNALGASKGRFCKHHRQPGMVDVISKTCEHADCSQRLPSYNSPGAAKGRFCKTHKLAGMVDVRKKVCEHTGCGVKPSFNALGTNRGRFCKEHKLTGMTNVINKTCEYAGCGKQPYFNDPGTSRGRFCKTHKLAGMVDVKNRTCEQTDCHTMPYFNSPGTTKGLYCWLHKLEGMVDVRNKTCEHADCNTQPSYGLPGHAPSYCAPHHPEGTMKHPKRRCTVSDCREWSTHGITQPERCERHALPGDDNLVERACANCNLPNVLNAHDLCGDCSAWLTGKRPRLAKQREVLQFLDHELQDFPYDSTDRTPQDLRDCDRRERPDVMWDRADRIVILEIDEDQHKDRPCECEQTRMMNISQALGSERTIWIRYNPDAFRGPDSRRWTSKAKRHELLKQWLTWALTSDLPHTISVIHLFFDGFREDGISVEKFL